jgi:hypothetical protein
MDHVELKIIAEHRDERLLHRFIEELQRLEFMAVLFGEIPFMRV